MKKKLLIIGFVWPEPKSSAAGSRMLQLIEQFQQQEFEITFTCAAKTSKNTYDLSQIGVAQQTIALNDSSFDDFILKLQPNAVLFDRFMVEEQYGWRVAEHCPDAIRILDTEDFHGLRKARELALKRESEVTLDLLQNDTTVREIASIYRCDLSLMISEAEIDILTHQFKIDKELLYYLPFLLEPVSDEIQKQLPKFKEREHFITIGNFLHPPNYDAVLYLKEQIWPLIRKKLLEAQLHIYGAYESQKVTQLHNEKQGFLIKGFAENVNEVMQNAKVCLAPLRFGAGLKGKLIDALQNGTPCVMSIIAAEGMFGIYELIGESQSELVEVFSKDTQQGKTNGFITNNPEHFAEKAIKLYTNEELWQTKQDNGFRVLENRFNKEQFTQDFAELITTLQSNLTSHRQKNFIGKLLQHHTLQSTKYLSKWIEEKNKLI